MLSETVYETLCSRMLSESASTPMRPKKPLTLKKLLGGLTFDDANHLLELVQHLEPRGREERQNVARMERFCDRLMTAVEEQ